MASLGRYDLFYAADDGATRSHRNVSATTSGNVTLAHARTQFSTTGSQRFEVGGLAKITSGGNTAFCRVVAPNASLAYATLLPLNSSADSGDPIEATFAAGSTITSDETTPAYAVRLVIDLRSASESSIDYIVAASGSVSTEAISGPVAMWVQHSEDLDPLSGTEYNRSRVTLNWQSGASAFDDKYQFTAFSFHTLAAGRVHTLYLYFAGESAGETRMDNSRLVAIRAGAGVVRDGNGTSADDTAGAIYADLGANAVEAGAHLVLASYSLGTTNAVSANPAYETSTPDHRIEVGDTGGSALQRVEINGIDTDDRYPMAFAGIYTFGASNRLRIRSILGGSLMQVARVCLIAVPLDELAIAGSEVTAFTTHDATTVSPGSTWTELRSSGSKSIDGSYIEFACGSFDDRTGSGSYELRPNWGGTTDLGLHTYTLASSDPEQGVCFFTRSEIAGSSRENKIEVRFPDDASASIYSDDVYFSFLEETAALAPHRTSDPRIVVESEAAVVLKHDWTTVATDRYSYDLSGYADVDMVRRFRVGHDGQVDEFVQRADYAGNPQSFYFDTATRTLYVEWYSGGSFAPEDDDVYPVAIVEYRAGVTALDLVRNDRTGVGVETLPYEPRLLSAPDSGSALTTTQGRMAATSNISEASLATADRFHVDLLGSRVWQGWRTRVLRGYEDLSLERADFETIARAVQGQARIDPTSGTLSLELFDRSVELLGPIATDSVTAYVDGSTNTERTNTALPVVYGSLLRVPAVRTTQNVTSGGSNTYKIAGHALSAISAVRFSEDDRPITGASYTAGSAELDAGEVVVLNAAKYSNGDFVLDDRTEPPDQVYVDLVGRTSTVSGSGASSAPALRSPGEIVYDLLTTYTALGPDDVERYSLDRLDRGENDRVPARSQRESGLVSHSALDAGLVVSPGTAGIDAINAYLESLGGLYLTVNRQGRFAVREPDLGLAPSLIANPGLEESNSYPWGPEGYTVPAFVSRSTAESYAGDASLLISNWLTADVYASTRVVLPEAGTYALSFVCKGSSGSAIFDAVRVEILDPRGTSTLGEALTVSATEWRRFTTYHTVDRAYVGETEIRIYPAHGSTLLSSIYLDEITLVRVVAVCDETNSTVASIEIDPETYQVVEAPFGEDISGTEPESRLRIKDAEARGLGAVQSEAAATLPDSGTLSLRETLHRTGESVGGALAPLALYYSRPRIRVGLVLHEFDRVPELGEFVAIREHRMVPPTPDGYPLWRILTATQQTARSVTLLVEQQADPTLDRRDR